MTCVPSVTFLPLFRSIVKSESEGMGLSLAYSTCTYSNDRTAINCIHTTLFMYGTVIHYQISSVGLSIHYTVNTYMYISSVGSSTHYAVNICMYISSVGSSTHYKSTHYTVYTYMYISSVGSSTHYAVNIYIYTLYIWSVGLGGGGAECRQAIVSYFAPATAIGQCSSTRSGIISNVSWWNNANLGSGKLLFLCF